ncbi:MAG TPA: efflux RND transporter periplasmic adaptor subunit [Povalibacter sp.]|uniref:efflux RND transporter periplasmic adaptor subunit n=1 Tax=Povalibacter sp. TaxID=1962978 RepID=UPI002B7124BA|nr:efflux RND transporter periplasmic adaptor subunit [Povalibacter sp.]HMN45290.1 efflux RND transporter periplasmic adaptor subunit [Povalibacter sp.]
MNLSELSDRLPQTRRGRIALTAAVLAVIAVAIVLTRPDRGEKVAATAPASLTVTTTTLSTTKLARAIVANGTVFPWQDVIIGPEVGGYRVASVNVDVGDRVRQGQELVRLSDELLVAEVASKRANVQQAQATLENAASALRRAQPLANSSVLSASDLDKLRSEEVAAQARVEVAKAELEGAALRLRYAHVTAPDDGVISSRTVTVGQIAQAGAEMLRLVRKGRIEWRAEIPESRMREIKIGQSVALTTADGARIEGKVRTVAPTVESATRAGLVYVDIPAGSARPGMFARGEIVLAHSESSMVPVVSVVIEDGYSYVFVVDGDIVHRRRVQTGTVDGNLIEVLDGVTPDDRIVDKGAGFLKDGDRVNVVAADAERPS